MAEEECKAAVTAGELRAAAQAVYEAYDLALELQLLLEAFNDLEPAPKWAFPLSSYASRAARAVDVAHTGVMALALRFEGAADLAKPAMEARL